MRQEVMDIINRYKLNQIQVARMSGVSRNSAKTYLKGGVNLKEPWANKDIERSVVEWRFKLFVNRRRLLRNTHYAHLYQKVDGTYIPDVIKYLVSKP